MVATDQRPKAAVKNTPRQRRHPIAPLGRFRAAAMIHHLARMAALLLALEPATALAQSIDQNLWGTDGTVTAIARSGNTLFIGGAFSWVGPSTGGVVRLSATSGLAIRPLPKVVGFVNAAIPDEHGGWYIGGAFSAVEGEPRSNLAHILADGSLARWAPGTDAVVYAMALEDSRLYVAGPFGNIAGKPHPYLAALDTRTGELIPWDAKPNGPVGPIEVKGEVVYVGGWFTSIGGQPRGYVAALSRWTAAATPWDPEADGAVWAFATKDEEIYMAGGFSHIGGQPRSYLAAVSRETATASAWNPDPTRPTPDPSNPMVATLAISRNTVYLVGGFSKIGGQARAAVAAVDAKSGAATSWNPNPSEGFGYPTAHALAISGDRIFVGGLFTNIGGKPRNNIAELDASSGAASPWDPYANNRVTLLVASGDEVLASGDFSGVGGQRRTNLAAINVSTGEVESWNPNPDGLVVYTLAVDHGSVYVGGDFRNVGGQPRVAIAALDTLTGAATAWSPNADEIVRAIVVSGGTVYAGGGFTHIGGRERNYLAAIDAKTGAVTDWNPNADTWVLALAVSGNTVYAGGFFEHVGGVVRGSLAAIDASTGVATNWNPNPDDVVLALAVLGNSVFAGGDFTTIGGQSRSCVASLDAVTGVANDWNPNPSGALQDPLPIVYALAASGNTVYIGGDFYSIGGRVRKCIAAVDAASGVVDDWDAGADNVVWSVAAGKNTVYAGGAFQSMKGLPCANLAAIKAVGLSSIALFERPPWFAATLGQSWPNPVRSRTAIRFAVPSSGPVTLCVYDVQGRKVATLLDHEVQPAGEHEAELRTGGWSAGCYFYRLDAGSFSATRKMLVAK
jgi:trimeric autotransporter adhesin